MEDFFEDDDILKQFDQEVLRDRFGQMYTLENGRGFFFILNNIYLIIAYKLMILDYCVAFLLSWWPFNFSYLFRVTFIILIKTGYLNE